MKGAAARPVQLPALFVAADAASQDGQRGAGRTVAIQLVLLVVAAVGGAVSLRVGGGIAPGPLLGGGAFLAALMVGLIYERSRPDKRWYEGRAAAESVKTLAWRYAVGGTPFKVVIDDREATERFVNRLQQLVGQLGEQPSADA